MKKILILIAMIMFPLTANATNRGTQEPHVQPAMMGGDVMKDMLEQVTSITSGYRTVVGNCVYTVKRKTAKVVVIRFYDANSRDSNPEQTDMQAVFLKTSNGTKLVAITFSPVDVTKYIDLLVE